MKKSIFLIVLLFILNINVKALKYGGCDYSSVSRMKALVNNINVYYDYHIQDEKAYFDVTLTNIMPGMRFIDSYNNKTYYYSDTNDGELTITNYASQSGNYKFYFDNSDCSQVMLGTKYYSFPYYNPYYNDVECDGISDFSLCQRWVSRYYSYSQFVDLISEYKHNKNNRVENTEPEKVSGFLDIIIDFYLKNYYYILPAIIIVFGLIYVIYRRKTRFKL